MYSYEIDEQADQVVFFRDGDEWYVSSFFTLEGLSPAELDYYRKVASIGSSWYATRLIARDELLERGLIAG